jgi:pimeloyl-ACP methyl ester carboxylesterase
MLSRSRFSAIRRIVAVVHTGYVEQGAARIFYRSAGEGPAILFIHAGVADSRMWRDQVDLDGFRTVAFDQRGFGNSEWVAEPYANRTDALAVLDHLGVEQAVVVGCSNGGEAAMQLAIVAPERVRALVLVGAAARGWEPEEGWVEDPLWQEAVAAFKAGDLDKVVEVDARTWLAGPNRTLEDIDSELVALFREMDRLPVNTESERDEYVQPLDPPTNDQLDKIDAPTLVIVGEHDLPNVVESAHYLAGRLGDRPAVVLEDTAHLPSMDQPDRFNQVLMAFLKSL